MSDQNRGPSEATRRSFLPLPLFTFVLALAAIAATYGLSTSDYELDTKLQGFVLVVGLCVLISAVAYVIQVRAARSSVPSSTELGPEEPKVPLEALNELSELFAGKLGSGDAFRLAANRIRDLVDVRGIVLYTLDETRTHLVARQWEGRDPASRSEVRLRPDEGLVGQAFTTKQAAIDAYLQLDESEDHGSSVALPLLNAGNVFAVLHLFFDDSVDPADIDLADLEGIAARVAPLILGSVAYERSRLTALTDAATDLPNERAFYLVLENQVAEAQRKRGERPMTVLALDIKGFDEINCTFGHAAGDRLLSFVARTIKECVRQMDLVARAHNDEFLVVLPTADKEISHEIIARIRTGFFGRKVAINESQAVEIEMNIGWAAFGADGETPGQLLSLAQLRKEQSKSTRMSNVLWFPQDSMTHLN